MSSCNNEKDSSKRRKISTSNTIESITDLTGDGLAAISSYLPQTSRVLFAVALGRSEIIEQHKWEVLDFSDIERDLAARLSDDDISNVLKCIHAKTHLKRLNISGCVNIVGCGLEPLRGSLVLEQIDLGMVAKYESPNISPAPKLSEDEVLPILESINNANCSLKHVVFPHRWRNDTRLNRFLGDYAEYLKRQRRGLPCLNCDDSLGNVVGLWRNQTMPGWYGLQAQTCYDCLRSSCGSLECRLSYCSICDKFHCKDCLPESLTCSNCDKCDGCLIEHKQCSSCDINGCQHCMLKCGVCKSYGCSEFGCLGYFCCEEEGCTVAVCEDCQYNAVNLYICGGNTGCGTNFCPDHAVSVWSKCRGCSYCFREIGEGIYPFIDGLEAEINKLRLENEALRKEVNE